jgi:hypothetical protein
MAEDYLPREDDILRARKITQGMDQLTFKQNVSFIQIPYARHYNQLLIRNRS